MRFPDVACPAVLLMHCDGLALGGVQMMSDDDIASAEVASNPIPATTPATVISAVTSAAILNRISFLHCQVGCDANATALAAIRPANRASPRVVWGLRSAQRHAEHGATAPGSRRKRVRQDRRAPYNETPGILTGILTGSFSAKVPLGRGAGEPPACRHEQGLTRREPPDLAGDGWRSGGVPGPPCAQIRLTTKLSNSASTAFVSSKFDTPTPTLRVNSGLAVSVAVMTIWPFTEKTRRTPWPPTTLVHWACSRL